MKGSVRACLVAGPVLLLWCLVGMSALYGAVPHDRPLGTLVWTDRQSAGDWKIRFHVFLPDIRKPDGLVQSGTFKYDGREIKAARADEIMHPAFDYTGVRLFFSSGRGIRPNLGPDTLKLDQPLTRIWKFEKGSSAAPFAQASGWDYVFNPAPDHIGKFVYYNKFVMNDDGSVPPGIHIYRADFQTGANEALVVENALYPVVSVNDRRIVFVRQMPNEDNLPATPVAMGVCYVDVDPETGEADPSGPRLITPELGADFTGMVDTSKNPKPVWRGPIRCSKAAVFPDEHRVVFALQDYRYGTTDPSWTLWTADCDSPGDEPEVLQADPQFDDFWPSVSSDGNWVAHVRHVINDNKYKIAVTRIDDPSITAEPQGMGDCCLWPCFDQDNDVPNLEIRLLPGDSNKPTLIRLTDVEPDEWTGSNVRDKFRLYVEGSNFTDDMSTEFKPSTTAEMTWSKDELPAHLPLLLSTKTSYKSHDHGKYKPIDTFDGCPDEYKSAGGAPLVALYLEEGARLKIDILARDGRYLRPNTGDMNPEEFRWGTRAANYHDNQWENSRIPSIPGRNTDPPYFPRVSRSAINQNYPGVSWWIVGLDGNPVEGSDAALYHIFRKPNYPQSCSNYDADKPYFLRIVAQDLWMNKTDILIPIYVWDKKSKVRALDLRSRKRR